MHGYTTAFTVSAVLLAFALVAAGVLVRASRHHVSAPAEEADIEIDQGELEPAMAESVA